MPYPAYDVWPMANVAEHGIGNKAFQIGANNRLLLNRKLRFGFCVTSSAKLLAITASGARATKPSLESLPSIRAIAFDFRYFFRQTRQ